MSIITPTTLALKKVRETKSLSLTKCNFSLNNFSYLNGNDVYTVKRCWAVNDTDLSITLFVFRNSRSGDHLKPKSVTHSLTYTTNIGGYLRLRKALPDTIIQPMTFAEKVLNLIFHENIKLNDHHAFNKKYQLQSVSPKQIEHLLPRAFIKCIEQHSDIHVEIRGQECIAYFFREIQENDAAILAELLETLNL